MAWVTNKLTDDVGSDISGLAVGVFVGSEFVGCIVGNSEGIWVGWVLGAVVTGAIDGTSVGKEVVGYEEGSGRVGVIEGKCVGSASKNKIINTNKHVIPLIYSE